jgi:hypothetical protein
MVMPYVPGVAVALVTELVGVTLNTMLVGLTEVTVAVRGVALPSAAPPVTEEFVRLTVAPVSKPVPVTVTTFAPLPSKITVGEIDV